ncbi:uncharacterized protein BP01DRAFT_134162 [Aspergillus saccharolyticus JOP 1030-1]|uniref:Uncharacterized protein n=1 Tax=Aspergillus saccharolyticus JOP 1030-1 TaxID=1450539 RepID=A0A318Z5G8_9EURO|nr:hypothetical protein BP01DRAFT_134162 [Aspergillus saccharolyticus JOP 1030-1]PYH42561.1 hypothetical protein BP01DRAFT_134162 [Aspergillus saccharolyticus JOP 1030-1]
MKRRADARILLRKHLLIIAFMVTMQSADDSEALFGSRYNVLNIKHVIWFCSTVDARYNEPRRSEFLNRVKLPALEFSAYMQDSSFLPYNIICLIKPSLYTKFVISRNHMVRAKKVMRRGQEGTGTVFALFGYFVLYEPPISIWFAPHRILVI